ncbi:undecaprenyl-phosphate galactose phosphotransferase WbaP [Breznakiellaceae bacterium SP9]
MDTKADTMTLDDFDRWYRKRYRRTSSALTSVALMLSDLFGVMLSFGAGFFLVNLYDMSLINFRSFVTYWPYLPVFLLIFQIMHLYPGVLLAPAEELRNFVIGSFMAHGGIIVSRYIEDAEVDSISLAFLISAILSTTILLVCRDRMYTILRKTGLGDIPAVIFGAGDMSHRIVDRLLNNRKTGYVPVLILNNKGGDPDWYHAIPIVHDVSLGSEIVRRYNIKMAIVAMPEASQNELDKLMNYSVSAFRYNVLIPKFFSMSNIWMSIRDFNGILGFATSQKLKMPWNTAAKRLLDISVVLIGGIIISPLLLAIALLVKISSPGPILFGHSRLGRNRKPFKAYKFRSMVADANVRLEELLARDPQARAEWEASHKLKDDPRITKVGKLLRKLSVDEFPQFINVLKGEMSLVGPRPVVQDEVAKYGENFDRIFSLKPGLSGLWQVSGRSDTDYGERVSYDTYYMQSWSVWLDIWILYKTIGVVFKGKGAY